MRQIDRPLVAAAFAIWVGCGAVMGIGQSTTTMDNALIIHAFAAPVIVACVSWVYFARTRSNRVFVTAAFFTGFAMALDFFLVSLMLLRSFDMFASLIGTWIPFGLIFASAYLTGSLASARRRPDGVLPRMDLQAQSDR